jgi:hypothetical protein
MSERTKASLDTPIRSAKEDRLDRGPFAQLIADALLEPNLDGATVAGLIGPWGTGKSSVANLVAEIIDERVTTVRFEPWMVTTREALAAEFFATLGRHVLPKVGEDDPTAKRSRFYRYASKALGVISVGAQAVGTVIPGVSVGANTAKSASEVLDLAAQGLELHADGPSLREARDEISKDLRDLPLPVLIVIDDIDRLDRDEVRTLFQLIKACADFPNVRYLLLFDREQVLHALEGAVNDPSAFLEKIVTLQFDLPEATSRQRSALLDEALSSLGIHETLEKQHMDRLAMAFDEVLLPGLSTVRQVKRFVSTVRALLPGVIVDGHRNVDPADFLVLEYLRQYVPSVYSVIRDEEAPLAGGKVARMVHYKEWPAKMKKRRDDAIEALPESPRPLAKEALQALYKSSGASDVGARRFNTSMWRPVYLGFHSGRAGVSEQDWQAFLLQLKEPDKPQVWLDDWSDRAKREQWVTAISTRTLEIPWLESMNLLKILFEWGDQQNQETSQFFGAHHSWEFCIRFCTDAIMSVTPDELNPVDEMRKILEKTSSVVAPGYCIGTELERNRKQNYDRWARDYDLEPITQPLREKLSLMLDNESIWTVNDVSTAITATHYLVEEDCYKKWWGSIPSNEPRLIQYLNRNLGEAESFNYGFEEGPLIKAIREIDPAKLNDLGRKAREYALDAVTSNFGRPAYRRRPVKVEADF